MGGQTGFGPVPVGEDGEPPFAADWEARLPPEVYLGASYYERWLGAIEMLVAEKGVA